MEVEKQLSTGKNSMNSDFAASANSMNFVMNEKINRELVKNENDSGIFGSSIFSLPTKIVLSDVKSKFGAGFERWIYGVRELRIYVFPFSTLQKLPKSDIFKKNCFEDLLLYRQTSLTQPTRKKFLQIARERLDKGINVYTYCENGSLVSYVWLDPDPKSYYGSGVDQEIEAIPDSVYVQDIYTNPFLRTKGLGQAGFCQLAHDALTISGKNCMYMAIFATNIASRLGVEKLGAIHQRSYFCKTRFGLRKTWKIENE